MGISNDAQMPLISVIVPVFNAEKYLPEALRSILKQTLADFELLVVYDRSKDRSLEILEEYARGDSRLKIIAGPGKGLPSALNSALEVARGKYIARMDADDICVPNRFEKQVRFLEEHPDVGIVGSSFTVFDDRGALRVIRHPTEPLELFWKMITDTKIAHPTVMFRRSALGDARYPDVEAEDFALFSRMMRRTKIANIGEPLLSYRTHRDNKSLLPEKKARLRAAVNRTYLETYADLGGPAGFEDVFWNFRELGVIRVSQFASCFLVGHSLMVACAKRYGIPRTDKRFIRLQAFFIRSYLGAFARKIPRLLFTYTSRDGIATKLLGARSNRRLALGKKRACIETGSSNLNEKGDQLMAFALSPPISPLANGKDQS